jgi:hypothetical protein
MVCNRAIEQGWYLPFFGNWSADLKRRYPGLRCAHSAERRASLQGHSRICAPITMIATPRAQLATAHQGSRTLSATAWLLSPRQTENKKLKRRKKAFIWGRIHHGNARAIKNMRRVRLSLVPHGKSGDRLLQ